MLDVEIKYSDPEEIEDLLVKVETSFDIKFIENELAHISTFGELVDYIVNKIEIENTDDCTSQQAFYKLREAITSILPIEANSITPDSLLEPIFQREKRRSIIQQVEIDLGFSLNILQAPKWLTGTLLLLLLSSCVMLYFNWKIGILGIIIALFGTWFSNKLGKELNLKTVGQVAEKMTRESYLKSRRNPQTVNKTEIKKILMEWFAEDLELI